jgi:hypothetical protein
MRALEVKQAIEERELLSVPPSDPQHLPAFSAPTTPPRVPSVVNGHQTPTFEFDLAISSSKPTKRKSVTYAPTVSHSPDASAPYLSSLHPHSFARTPGAKSMPASRRTSASSEQLDELSELTLHALAINERQHPASAHPSTRSRTQDHLDLDSQYNAGSMLDDELDKEIHSLSLPLPRLCSIISSHARRHHVLAQFQRRRPQVPCHSHRLLSRQGKSLPTHPPSP